MSDAILTPDELDDLSEELDFARPDVCTFYQQVENKGRGGGARSSWQVAGVRSCRVEASARQAEENPRAGAMRPMVPYNVFIGRGFPVSPDWEVEIRGVRLKIAGVPGLESFAAEMKIQVISGTDQPL